MGGLRVYTPVHLKERSAKVKVRLGLHSLQVGKPGLEPHLWTPSPVLLHKSSHIKPRGRAPCALNRSVPRHKLSLPAIFPGEEDAPHLRAMESQPRPVPAAALERKLPLGLFSLQPRELGFQPPHPPVSRDSHLGRLSHENPGLCGSTSAGLQQISESTGTGRAGVGGIEGQGAWGTGAECLPCPLLAPISLPEEWE